MQLDKDDPNYQSKLDGFNANIENIRNDLEDNIKSIYLSQATQH